ncbi:MAG: DUF362 domain-containing protein [Candidatus Thorarchaeota archaeon]|nr:MAG: DUF362 domain-containing protein [Candidatus Thorarchaeota archaeon]
MEFTSEVAVSVKRSPAEALKTALSKLSVPIVLPKNTERVIIKPSIYDPSLPGNTDVNMVRAVGRMFKSLSPVKIVESDNPLRTTADAFSRSGYNALIEEHVELVNLTDVDMVSITFPGHYFKNRRMPKLFGPGAFLINVATLKAEPGISTIGAGIKNLFGLLPELEKSVYHSSIDAVLMDLLSIYRPQLSIIDLTQLVVGDRKNGRVKKVGGVVVGTDPVAVDAYCASLLGYDPLKVSHLYTANNLGFGEILLDLIRVIGTEHQIEELAKLCKI